MVRSTLVRTVSLLVLCAVLASPLASAAAPRPGHGAAVRMEAPGVAEAFGWFKKVVVSWWSKNGCGADPYGRCVDASVQAGCRLDPFGRCVDASVKNGCRADPFGRCVDELTMAPTAEAGCEVDPFGRCGS
jgi:hypothetical protein